MALRHSPWLGLAAGSSCRLLAAVSARGVVELLVSEKRYLKSFLLWGSSVIGSPYAVPTNTGLA